MDPGETAVGAVLAWYEPQAALMVRGMEVAQPHTWRSDVTIMHEHHAGKVSTGDISMHLLRERLLMRGTCLQASCSQGFQQTGCSADRTTGALSRGRWTATLRSF